MMMVSTSAVALQQAITKSSSLLSRRIVLFRRGSSSRLVCRVHNITVPLLLRHNTVFARSFSLKAAHQAQSVDTIATVSAINADNNKAVVESTASTRRREAGEKKKKKSSSKLGAYADLAKARLSALVVTTTAAGFLAAGPMPLSESPETLVSVLLGTALCSSSAAGWNQIIEIPRDKQMKRTQHRPLVNGDLSVSQATTAATVWGMSGTALLWFGTDPITCSLGVGNLLLYSTLYTYLKPVSTINTWVGAVVGAVPPVMGFTAAAAAVTTSTGGSVDLTSATYLLLQDPIAWTLGSTLYLWQLPHFLALSYMYKTDYSRGGFAMLPCPDPSNSQTAANADVAAEHTAQVIVRYAWYLSAVPIVSTLCHVTNSMYAMEGLVLNGYALYVAHNFYRERTNQNARKIFLTSLWYLPCTLMLFLLHSKTWDDDIAETDKKKNTALAQFLVAKIHAIRDYGRELCVHERHQVKGPHSCPVVVGTETTKETVDHAARTVSDVVHEAAAVEQALPLEVVTTLASKDSSNNEHGDEDTAVDDGADTAL